MFNKTRKRIVFTVILSLLSLMVITLVTIYISNRIALQKENIEILKMYVERYSLEDQPSMQGNDQQGSRPAGKPDERPGDIPALGPPSGENKPGSHDSHPEKEPQFQLSTFYAVAYSADGDILSINNGNNSMQSEETLLEITASILKSGKENGRTGNLTYLVEKRRNYTLVAMIDGTINASNQSLLMRQMLVIGAMSLVILAVIAFFLAKKIVRPLEENDKKQKRFVSDAGHELKTPIAVISANSELLRRKTGDSEWLDNIDYENSRMSELVKQLLSLSKADNGEMPKEILDFSELVNGETLPLESFAFERGKEIGSEIEPGLMVKGNPAQLRQLVSILLDNAIAHGTGKKIGLTLKREKHNAVLTVKNDAETIDADQLEHLFDRFYKADEARSDNGSHYGLGLSIAKAVADSHGGHIEAAYKDGKAIFSFFIPMEKH